MMATKFYTKFLFIFIAAIFISCEDDDNFTVLNENATTSLELSTDTVVMTEDNADQEILEVTWQEPNFGFPAAPSYNIEIDLAGNDFASAKTVAVGSELSKTFTSDELNKLLLNIGITPLQETEVEMRLKVILSQAKSIYSPVSTLQVTAFSSILDLSTDFGVVGDATPGGWSSTPETPIQDIPFYTTSEDGIIVAYTSLRDGDIKFRKNNQWNFDYGDNDNNGTLDEGGADIPVTAGDYRITLNLNNLTYTMEEFSWGIVGDATIHGWDAPDVKLHYNSFNDNWVAAVTLTDGEIKFRQNEEWNTDFGGSNGTLAQGGDNIAVTTGHYIITVDFKNLTYNLEETNLWGLTGDATTFGWEAPDVKFLPDFGTEDGKFYANGVELMAGEVKVRQNEEWNIDYGDNGNDGTLEEGGDNIPVDTPGIYNIEIDFSANPPTISFYPWEE
ncbi:SusE outer membrane protein [Psychroflexus halocasei]|uniref:SusE outer membrane protein n=2 Tax=Psychroflexus halocasei TaxID=908615 RepID=A0A1H3WX21_9FLAO|nr:SusE outer membrane protein [Psychroflexus halocasei]